MAKKLYPEQSVQAIAAAIRAKDGISTLMKIADMPDRISAIETGGGGPDLSSDTVTADTMLNGITAHNSNGVAITGNIPTKSNSDLTSSGATVTVPAGYYSAQSTKAVANGSAGSPIATKGTVSNHTITVTPSVTNTAGYITGGTKTGTAVSVSASELVSGTKEITTNGTDIDVTEYQKVDVNVSGGGGGGSSIFVTGDFVTGASAGASSITINYSGSGYPVACIVHVKNGAYNNTSGAGAATTAWYNEIQRYAVGQWTMHKAQYNTTPTYTTSGSNNYGVTTAIYKNSTSSATSYTRTSAMNSNTFSSSNANNAALTCVKFKGNKTLSYYVNTSSYGLMPNTSYTYYIVYSS